MSETSELITKFNNYFPVGAMVKWRIVAHPSYKHQEYKVKTRAYDHFDQPVAFLEGRSGFVSIKPEFVDYSVIESLDWKAAELHFDGVRKTYQALAGTSGVNTELALERVFKPLSERFDKGERSEKLFNEMMNVE